MSPRLLATPFVDSRPSPVSSFASDNVGAATDRAGRITYPHAGWVGARAGLNINFLGLTALLSSRLWLYDDPAEIEHRHEDLDATSPHLHGRPVDTARCHPHDDLIDDEHRSWPP